MAKITLLESAAQPQRKSRLIDWLEDNLQKEQYSHFIFETAFAKQNPFIKLSNAIGSWTQCGKTITAYMGIDHKGTSIQALQNALLCFNQVYITHARYSTFHPKTYLFYGDDYAAFYSGSNNFTSGGLETNFESGLFIDLTLSDVNDKMLLDKLLDSYSVLNNEFDCCIALDEHILLSLQENNCLLDETVQSERHIGKRPAKTKAINSTIDLLFGNYRARPPRALPKPSITTKPNSLTVKKVAGPVSITGTAVNSAAAANGLVVYQN